MLKTPNTPIRRHPSLLKSSSVLKSSMNRRECIPSTPTPTRSRSSGKTKTTTPIDLSVSPSIQHPCRGCWLAKLICEGEEGETCYNCDYVGDACSHDRGGSPQQKINDNTSSQILDNIEFATLSGHEPNPFFADQAQKDAICNKKTRSNKKRKAATASLENNLVQSTDDKNTVNTTTPTTSRTGQAAVPQSSSNRKARTKPYELCSFHSTPASRHVSCGTKGETTTVSAAAVAISHDDLVLAPALTELPTTDPFQDYPVQEQSGNDWLDSFLDYAACLPGRVALTPLIFEVTEGASIAWTVPAIAAAVDVNEGENSVVGGSCAMVATATATTASAGLQDKAITAIPCAASKGSYSGSFADIHLGGLPTATLAVVSSSSAASHNHRVSSATTTTTTTTTTPKTALLPPPPASPLASLPPAQLTSSSASLSPPQPPQLPLQPDSTDSPFAQYPFCSALAGTPASKPAPPSPSGNLNRQEQPQQQRAIGDLHKEHRRFMGQHADDDGDEDGNGDDNGIARAQSAVQAVAGLPAAVTVSISAGAGDGDISIAVPHPFLSSSSSSSASPSSSMESTVPCCKHNPQNHHHHQHHHYHHHYFHHYHYPSPHLHDFDHCAPSSSSSSLSSELAPGGRSRAIHDPNHE